MSRRLVAIAAWSLPVLTGWAGQAAAQPDPRLGDPEVMEPAQEPRDQLPFEEPPAAAERAPIAPSTSSTSEPQDTRWTEQGIGASLGVALGGTLTPGGLRISGSYLYRLSETDWFDGAASFTIGSGAAECFRDRDDQRLCDHGAVDGFAVDFIAAIRRSWPARGDFTPFARVGLGLRFLRFAEDQVAGLAVPLIGAGGLSVALTPTMRLVTTAQLEVGGGLFSRGLGTAPQLGLAIGAGVEFAIR